ncbi:scarecrow-like protein 8 [Ricinus communis]|uniref:DELLA protein GAI, putative n=1 Tax=Ricinus communis TaxID=3988 RepID=B9RIU5_RICCO|nr:scarecrow-like protein 8 [Ricinus communis]EEF49067.1 DELLA protein GAI, putative [Ricinus communis]|eukprot:XP_002513664.1 scarecrow-like protein 8 [Ricinus communis]
MASGFSGGGADFYTGIAGRSMNSNNNPSQPPYRTQLSQMFLDPASQIAHQRTTNTNLTTQSLIGKRTLADFQAHQQQNYQQQHQPNINPALLLRSVKPRMYQHTSPISTLSPIDFSGNLSPELPSLSQRYGGVPLLQQLRPHPINLGSGLPCMNTLQNHQHRGGQETQKKMMNRLQELEKQLLDDNDDEEGDAVSVITSANSNSEWSETIQNLITSSSSSIPISPSPTSSSSSTSVTTPLPNYSKHTLVEAASAIYDGKTEVASEILTRVSQVSNPRGNSEQRLMEYMSMALKSRLNSADNPPPVAELFAKEHIASTQLLYELSPCFKLGFMAANLAILQSTVDQPNSGTGFHVIDFDIGQGCQYLNLLHALSERLNGKPATVKITAVADNSAEEKERLKVVGTTLSQLAEQFGVSLHFNVVSAKLGDLSRESLGCEPEEPLAVNFAFNLYRMPDESVSTENPRDELLRRVKGLAPRVVTLVEQEMNTNTAPFMARVNEGSSYYGALFESIESTVQRDHTERVKVEEGLGRKLANSVACEGRDRVERCEVFGKWRARMGMAGFELKPVSQNIAESLKARLSSGNRVNPGFTVKEDNGGVCFGWMGKTLTVASAWR